MVSNQPWPRVMHRPLVREAAKRWQGTCPDEPECSTGLAIELRNHLIWVADLVTWWGRKYDTSRKREWRTGPAESENRSMYANSLYGNREIPGVTGCNPQSVRSGKAKGRAPDMYAPGKSDGGIISMKRTNKGAQSSQRRDQPPAEFVEKRPPAEGNCVQTAVTGTQGGSVSALVTNSGT